MTHLITKIEYINGDTRQSKKVNIKTDNLEAERSRQYAERPCGVIYFTYVTISHDNTRK